MTMARRRRKRASDGGRRVPEALSPFRSALYRRTWIGAALFGMGVWMERLAVGWFVLTVSGSVFLTALSFGLRIMPNLVIGPIAGAASDRLPRDGILVAVSLVRLVAVIGMGIAALADDTSVGVILALVLMTGGTNAFQITALQALIADIVPPERIGSAISLTSFGQRAVGGVGALAGGVLLARLGPGSTFLLAAVPLALAAAAFATLEVPRRAGRSGVAFTAEVIEGLRLLVGTPMVRLLLGMMILVEILGFSYNSLLPSVADRVLHVGPEGLGLLTASAALGSMFGTLALVLVADRWPRGPMLIAVFAGFGLLLLGLAASEVLLFSALMVAGIGAMAAMVDALEWMMLQTSVPDRLRGRALGGWNFAIGFGWLGPLVLGGFAHVAGVPAALALGGTLLILVAAVVGSVSQRLRRS